jgi:NAD(P)-dependent dehydrogenase (short-subunit alcohol dehydrogenase family)
VQFDKKVVVVTGGANGIGAALSRRFAREGAAVVVADLDGERAGEVAKELAGLSVPCDVGSEEDIRRVVAQAEAKLGPVDVFCSNAGIGAMGGVEVANPEWHRHWLVNVMAHVFAARAVLPRMLERGEGYLVNTASGAGLLSHVESAPYSVTKHAAVALAESLSIAHGGRGIRVSVICPGGVRTEMTREGAAGAEVDGMLEPDEAAEIILEGLVKEDFLILTHPVVRKYAQRKLSDYDRWIRGMRGVRDRVAATRRGDSDTA